MFAMQKWSSLVIQIVSDREKSFTTLTSSVSVVIFLNWHQCPGQKARVFLLAKPLLGSERIKLDWSTWHTHHHYMQLLGLLGKNTLAYLAVGSAKEKNV
jgi:hypothetical protein